MWSLLALALYLALAPPPSPTPAAKQKPFQTGAATWYGTRFHGRLTASGEQYDMFQLTAAHRTLPLGSRVRVTRLSNGRSVVVRITDRGPNRGRAVIDLSYAAARALGVGKSGGAHVRIDVLERDRTASRGRSFGKSAGYGAAFR